MQTWKPKIAASRDEAIANKMRYYEVPKAKGGITFSRNGAEFQELRMLQDKGSDSVMFLAELSDGAGGKTYDVMSPKNWVVMGLNVDPIAAFSKHLKDAVKGQIEAKKGACLETARKLKGAVSSSAMKLALKGEGYSDSEIEFACTEVNKVEEKKS